MVGLEEEVMLIDPERGWALAQRIDDVLQVLPDDLAGYVSAETHQAAIELTTDPHASVEGAVAQLRRLRNRLAETLMPLGLAAAVAGTHPLAVWSETEVTSASRYRLIHRTMRDLAMREPTFALHVHVGVPDPDRAIELYNRLRVHLPLLLAYRATRRSGAGEIPASPRPARSCSRHSRAPACRGATPATASGSTLWTSRSGSGALPEPTFLWWDVRPQPRFGTVEVRVMDAQSHVADTAALVALVQASPGSSSRRGTSPVTSSEPRRCLPRTASSRRATASPRA